MSAGSDPEPASHEPTRAFLLAQALDACIRAERRHRGAAERIIARQPAWARAELRRLLALSAALEASARDAVIPVDFRRAARMRLMRRIAVSREVAENHTILSGGWPARAERPHRGRWLWRGGGGGLLAATLLIGASLTASANALPGEPLYSVKHVREQLQLRLAPDDQSRALILLAEANARLDETARLLDQGRTEQVAQTTQAFDEDLDRATSAYAVTTTGSATAATTTRPIESELNVQRAELQNLLQSAPEPARDDLRQALVATERSRALVTDADVEESPADRASRRTAAAASGADLVATSVPEPSPTEAPVAHQPPPVDLVAEPPPTDEPPVVAADEEDRDSIFDVPAPAPPPAVATHPDAQLPAPAVHIAPVRPVQREHPVVARDDPPAPDDSDTPDDGHSNSSQDQPAAHARVVEQPVPPPIAHQPEPQPPRAVQHNAGDGNANSNNDGNSNSANNNSADSNSAAVAPTTPTDSAHQPPGGASAAGHPAGGSGSGSNTSQNGDGQNHGASSSSGHGAGGSGGNPGNAGNGGSGGGGGHGGGGAPNSSTGGGNGGNSGGGSGGNSGGGGGGNSGGGGGGGHSGGRGH